MIDKILDKINKIVPARFRWVLEHGGFRKYFKNTGWMFLGQMASLLVAFFIGAWLARYLGPNDYGIFSYAIAFAGLFTVIANFGVDGILSRELVDKPDDKNSLLGTGFLIKLAGGLLAIFMLILAVLTFEDSLIIRQLVIIYSVIFIINPWNVISVFFQSQVRAKTISKIKILALVVSSILKIILILTGQGIIWLVWLFVLDAVLISLFSVIAYLKSGMKISAWTYSYSLAKKILSGSLFLILATAANYIFLRADQIMIGSMLGERAVGLYAVAVKFVEVWYFIPVIICGSLFPAIVNSKKLDIKVYLNRLRSFFWLLFVVGLSISAVTSAISPFVIKSLFSQEYINSILITEIYAWSNVGLFLGWGIYHYYLSENKLKNIFYFYFFSMLINVVLNYFFIKKFGLSGAAQATLISYSVGPLFVWILNKYKSKNILCE